MHWCRCCDVGGQASRYLCYHLIIILSSVGYTWLTTPSIVLYCIALYYIVLEHLYSAFSQHKALQKALHLYQHKEEEDQSLIKAGPKARTGMLC